MIGRNKKAEYKPQQEFLVRRYPPEDIQEMVKLKGFKTLEEMVNHFLDMMMERYYKKKGGYK